LVTGAAGGLGRVLTADLLSAGHGVVAIDIAAALPRLQQLEAAHPRRLIGRAAPRTDGEWLALLDDAQRTLSPITGAVLLAGGWRGGGAIGSEPDGELQTLIDRNLLAAHAALRALIPRLREHGGGAIVVIGSRVVERPWESAGAAAYAASKAALVTLAQVAVAENLDTGVRVNAVLPSTIDTVANRAAMPAANPDAWVDPKRLSRVIRFLLSDDAQDITGAALPVYGRL